MSPSSLAPDLRGVQIPGLAGYMLGNQERDYREIMDLQKLLGGMGAEKEQLNLAKAYKDVPEQDATREYNTLDKIIGTQQLPQRKQWELEGLGRTNEMAALKHPTDMAVESIAGPARVSAAKAISRPMNSQPSILKVADIGMRRADRVQTPLRPP